MRYESKRIIVYAMYLLVWPLGLPSHLAHKWFGSEALFESSAKILSLIEFLDRRRVLEFLVERVREQRPGSV